jgi:hypothetical protein
MFVTTLSLALTTRMLVFYVYIVSIITVVLCVCLRMTQFVLATTDDKQYRVARCSSKHLVIHFVTLLSGRLGKK